MKNIVLATDGSRDAEHAGCFLAHLPHDQKVQLTVLSVLQEPIMHHHPRVREMVNEYINEARVEAEETFRTTQQQFEGANVELRHIIRKGQPGLAIVDVAIECKAELVVVGATGKSNIDRIMLGSVSEYVATHAPCSVLIIRPNSSRKKTEPLKIAIGYEETESAHAAVEEFCEFRWGSQTDVRLLMVRTLSESLDEEIGNQARQCVKEAANQTKFAAANARGLVLEKNHAGEALVEFAETNELDLLVVGETPRNILQRILMGSTTRYVLRHANCSVWITRNRMIYGVGNERISSPEWATENSQI